MIFALTHSAFFPLVFVKPGREMLFVPLDSDSKYKVKAFLDALVYRSGDTISSQIEGVLSKISVILILMVGAFISLIWEILGLYLAKNYEKMDKN